jgi:hypothetical protein
MDLKAKEKRAQDNTPEEEVEKNPPVSDENKEAEEAKEEVVAAQAVKEPETKPEPKEDKAIKLEAKHEDFAAMQDMREGMATLTRLVEKVASKVDTMETERIQEKTVGKLEAIITQSTLDEDTKASLLDGIRKGEYGTVNEVQLAVKVAEQAVGKAIAAVQAAQGAPIFPGLSNLKGHSKNPGDINVLRSKLLWDMELTEDEQKVVREHGIRRFSGLQEEYKQVTGDDALIWSQNPEVMRMLTRPYQQSTIGSFAQATYETINYSGFMRNILDQKLVDYWNVRTMDKSYLKVAAIGEPFTDPRPEEELYAGQEPLVPEVAEGGDYQDNSLGATETVTTTSSKYGDIIRITEEMMLSDRIGYIKDRVRGKAYALNNTLARVVWSIFFAYGGDPATFNGVSLADSNPVYHSSRNNVVNGGLDDADVMKKIQQLINYVWTQVDIANEDEEAQPLYFDPYYYVCVKTKRGLVKGRLNGPDEPGRTDNFPNTLSLGVSDEQVIGLAPFFLYNHPEALGIIPNPAIYPGIEIRWFRGNPNPEMIWPGNQQSAYDPMFSNDSLAYKTKIRVRINRIRPKAFFLMYKSA